MECLIFFSITEWNSLKKIINKLSLIFIGSFSFIIIIWIWGYKIYDILFLKRGDTTSARTTQFIRLFESLIPNNTFWSGVGPGQYKYYMFYNIGYWDIDLHSQYLNILAEQGSLIFILFIIFNVYIFKASLSKCEDKLQKAFVTSLFIGNLICINYNPNQYYYLNNILYYLNIYCFMYKNNNNC